MSVKSAATLIIDADTDFTSELKVILEFLDETVVVCNDLDNWQASLAAVNGANGCIKAIVVRFDHIADTLQPLLCQVNQYDDRLPVIIMQGEQSFSQSMPIEEQVLGVLNMPVGKKELIGLLAEADAVLDLLGKHKSVPVLDSHMGLIGISHPIDQIRGLISQVANSDATVLVLGDSGTGKEVVVRALHDQSSRKDRPLVAVNCGAIPAELLESELFGHEKGAFTGAITSRQGRFEMADGGTLFLDEIGDMSLDMQVKLLRVLQERCFERVGSNKTIKVDVRIIAATHRNLEHLVSEGRFRLDLFYRLNVFPIEVPNLSERREDVPLLIKHFTERLKADKQSTIKFAPGALAALANYSWPGNVRELANLVERLSLLYPGKSVGWQDLPVKYRANEDWIAESEAGSPAFDFGNSDLDESKLNMPRPSILSESGIDLKQYLRDIEVGLINEALEMSNGIVSKAAKLLNLQRTTLVEKIRKYEINPVESVSGF
ncbi:MAG: sigma-54 dependent transcriptional regulator [Porticoccaceae bacterium]|nr:sigma-54 dependent transcriptional regulator [Porticoccaceae bacterium]